MKLAQNIWKGKKLEKILKEGGVVVMPTDTIYGIVGRAENKETVERIYTLRRRSPQKPCIILIGDMKELDKFSIRLTKKQEEKLKNHWCLRFPHMRKLSTTFKPTSIILDCKNERFSYLHRGTRTLAFRLPTNKDLRGLLNKTGPLIAPSANPEGAPTVKNIIEAKKYFGDLVDLYVDGGEIKGQASKIIKLKKDGSVEVLRD